MSLMNRNTLSFRSGGAPEDLEGLLRNFFRSEMPEPWPTMKAPVVKAPQAPARSAGRWAPVRRRLALAASVGFLMVGSWCLSARLDHFTPSSIEPAPNGSGSANGKRIFEKQPAKPAQPRPEMGPAAK